MADFSGSVTIAFQGGQNSFSCQAAQTFFQPKEKDVVLQPQVSLHTLFDSLLEGKCTYAVVPIESSSYGTIHGVYDHLVACGGKVVIVGEMGQVENYCLCVHSSKSAIKEVGIDVVVSHPHILESCCNLLDRIDSLRQAAGLPVLERLVAQDSASACSLVADSSSSSTSSSSPKVVAAIGSKEAADTLGLHCLVAGVGNDPNAETRYIVLARQQADARPLDPWSVARLGGASLACKNAPVDRRKASIALALRNIPGAIFKMASCFAFRNLDIIKIESRPSSVAMQLRSLTKEARAFSQRHWDLIFYLDFEPSADEDVNEVLLRNLREYSLWIRHLGAYKAGIQVAESQTSDWSQIADVISHL